MKTVKLDSEVKKAIAKGPKLTNKNPDGVESHKEFARRIAILVQKVERERAANLAVNSSIDDYGSLSYVADLIRN